MNTKDTSLWNRNCPDCGVLQSFATKDGLMRAVKFDRVCKKCANTGENNTNFGKIPSKEIKQQISKSLRGIIPWNKGKNTSKETRIKISSSIKGKKLSSETKYKLRLISINRIKNQGIFSSFNPTACKFIEEFGKKNGYNFQHALNGGEVELYGYFVDGYDKERNIIFEYDEPRHYVINGELRNKDLQRQKEIIENIKPRSFIRYDERNNKLYDVITNNTISEIKK